MQFASYQSEIGVVLRLCQQKHPVYVPTSYIPEKVSQEEKNERERERGDITEITIPYNIKPRKSWLTTSVSI